MSRNRWAYWILLIPFAALLITPIYMYKNPEILGVPYFIWWTFLWAPLTALCTYLVYRLQRPARAPGREDGAR